MPGKTEVKMERTLDNVFCDLVDKMADWCRFAAIQKDNKYGAREAGAVSRKAGRELGALLKEWRKVSVAAHKEEDGE